MVSAEQVLRGAYQNIPLWGAAGWLLCFVVAFIKSTITQWEKFYKAQNGGCFSAARICNVHWKAEKLKI